MPPVPTSSLSCPVPTKRGTACPHDVKRDGLCSLHHPDGRYAQQNEGYRIKLQRRPEVVAALTRAAARPTPPTPLPPPVPAPARATSRSSGLTGHGRARSMPRPAPGTVARAGDAGQQYLAELEYAAARLAKAVAEAPDPHDALAVARWRIAGQRALEAYDVAKRMRPAP